MLRALLEGPARKIYCGTGLLLVLLLPFCFAHVPIVNPFYLWFDLMQAEYAVCMAVISCAFAFLQDEVALSARVKTALACFYAVGMAMTVGIDPWLLDVVRALYRLAPLSGIPALLLRVPPGLVLLPVGAVFLGVLRSARRSPDRAYLLSGLCLMIFLFGTRWLSMFDIRIGPAPNINTFLAGMFWIPALPLVAAAGMLLGCVPHELHPPARLGHAMAICYLAAAALVPVGLCLDLNEHPYFTLAAMLAILFGVLVSASALRRLSRRPLPARLKILQSPPHPQLHLPPSQSLPVFNDPPAARLAPTLL